MKLSKIVGLGLGLAVLGLLSSASCEAHGFFGFGFSVAPRVYERELIPVYVDNCYEPVLVEERTCVGSRPCYREVYVQRPVQVIRERRVVVQPRPFFSFGFWGR